MARLKCLPPLLKTSGPAPKRPGWLSQHTTSATERGYGWAWQQARERVMRRDCGLCQQCAKADRVTSATEVDHIVPKFGGGSDDDSNLQAICHACHVEKTAAESRRARGLT